MYSEGRWRAKRMQNLPILILVRSLTLTEISPYYYLMKSDLRKGIQLLDLEITPGMKSIEINAYQGIIGENSKEN